MYQDMFDRLILRTGVNDQDELLDEILTEAIEIYKSCRFPNAANPPDEVEPQYETVVVLIALELYNRMGAEGQESHSENGISRRWSGDGWVSKDLLSRIVPYCGVVQ